MYLNAKEDLELAVCAKLIDLDTGKKILHCFCADDETGYYRVHLRNDNGFFFDDESRQRLASETRKGNIAILFTPAGYRIRMRRFKEAQTTKRIEKMRKFLLCCGRAFRFSDRPLPSHALLPSWYAGKINPPGMFHSPGMPTYGLSPIAAAYSELREHRHLYKNTKGAKSAEDKIHTEGAEDREGKKQFSSTLTIRADETF